MKVGEEGVVSVEEENEKWVQDLAYQGLHYPEELEGVLLQAIRRGRAQGLREAYSIHKERKIHYQDELGDDECSECLALKRAAELAEKEPK